jgi:hypothetical protein
MAEIQGKEGNSSIPEKDKLNSMPSSLPFSPTSHELPCLAPDHPTTVRPRTERKRSQCMGGERKRNDGEKRIRN